METPQPLNKADLFAPVDSPLGATPEHHLAIPDDLRHAVQLNGPVPPMFQPCFARSTTPLANREPQPICLFNLIVAMEWVPSAEIVAALKAAFSDASRLLYDVTDGYMAIGQVLLGGPELLPNADIQIFASNRLFPRSSVNAMNDQAKFRPIRLGRGLWNKNERTSIDWSTRSGYATIVHELGHHALGLKDQYLTFSQGGLVVPSQSLVLDTIMASLESSELLAPRTNRQSSDPDSEWEALRLNDRFSWLGISPTHTKSALPPQVPSPPIAFFATASVNGPAEEPLLVLDPTNVTYNGESLDLGYTWVYIVQVDEAGRPIRLLPQGSYEARADGFRLLGARAGDRLVLCGSERGAPNVPLNLWATIDVVDGRVALSPWQNATPATWPAAAVVAQGLGPHGPYTLKLDSQVPDGMQAQTFSAGSNMPQSAPLAENLSELDGHVVFSLLLEDGWKVAIASYSLGGSPASAYPAHPNPIPAGSPDGNAMIFFHAPANSLNYAALYGSGHNPEEYLIVTTTSYHHGSSLAVQPGLEPRSYAFSVTSNLPMGDLAAYRPTLVLYYDKNTRDDRSDELAIYRYDAGPRQWVRLAGYEDLDKQYFVAAPLNADNAPGLFADTPQPEYYRLFLRRNPAEGDAQPGETAG